ncbi:hypothetical protein C8Q76DRAFT_797449 [Earliella scabrosa]|nr:hypothetical protein C8Q76DRAFT_797449 [Earliella scabrosa]
MSNEHHHDIPRKRTRSVRQPPGTDEHTEPQPTAARPRRIRIHSPTPDFLSPSVPVGEERAGRVVRRSPDTQYVADLSRLELTHKTEPQAGSEGRRDGGASERPLEPSRSMLPTYDMLPSSSPVGPVGELLADDDRPEIAQGSAAAWGWSSRVHEAARGLVTPDHVPSRAPRTPDRLPTRQSETVDPLAGLASPGPVGEWTPRADRAHAIAVEQPLPGRRLSFAGINRESSPSESPVENPRFSPLAVDQTATQATRDHALRALSHSQTLLRELAEERESLMELRQAFGRTLGMRAHTTARHWLDYNRTLFAESAASESDTGEGQRR